jgi:hypothetical protein
VLAVVPLANVRLPLRAAFNDSRNARNMVRRCVVVYLSVCLLLTMFCCAVRLLTAEIEAGIPSFRSTLCRVVAGYAQRPYRLARVHTDNPRPARVRGRKGSRSWPVYSLELSLCVQTQDEKVDKAHACNHHRPPMLQSWTPTSMKPHSNSSRSVAVASVLMTHTASHCCRLHPLPSHQALFPGNKAAVRPAAASSRRSCRHSRPTCSCPRCISIVCTV